MQPANVNAESPEPKALDFNQRVEQSLAGLKDARARTVFELAIAALDHGRLQRAQQEADVPSATDGTENGFKVTDIPRQLAATSRLAAWLGFDQLPASKILGVGRHTTHLLYCAKALGHQTTVVAPPNPVNDRLMSFYGVEHFMQAKRTDMPDAKFSAIVSANLSHGPRATWAAFLRPLVALMTDDARLFLTVSRRPVPERKFEPETVLKMFEQSGARVSPQHFLIDMNKTQVNSFIDHAPAAPGRAGAAGHEAKSEAASAFVSGGAPDQKTVASIAAAVVALLVVAGVAVWFLR